MKHFRGFVVSVTIVLVAIVGAFIVVELNSADSWRDKLGQLEENAFGERSEMTDEEWEALEIDLQNNFCKNRDQWKNAVDASRSFDDPEAVLDVYRHIAKRFCPNVLKELEQ